MTETHPVAPPEAHPAGIRRVGLILLALAGLAALPYAIPAPGMEKLKVWREGRPVPFTRVFDFTSPMRSKLAGVRRTRAHVSSDDQLLEAAPLPDPAEALTMRPGAGYRTHQGTTYNADLRVPPAELAGMTRAIEDPDRNLDPFYERLASVARGQNSAVARIGLYSDSVNGADRVSSQLRHKMQTRFGDAGKGFLPVAPGWQYQRHQDVAWGQERRWKTFVVNRGKGPLDRYGYGGVLATNYTPNAGAFVATVDDGPIGKRVSVFTLFYQAHPKGGALSLTVDGKAQGELDTLAATVEDRVYEVRVPDGPHRFDLEVASGEARLYGIAMERDGPGVVVDGLALIGAFARVLRNWDEEHWKGQLKTRGTDLMIFWLGGNDSTSESVPFIHDQFIAQYGEVLARYREARPDASCLVMSVIDAAEERGGHVRTLPRIPQVVLANQEVARAHGCAFFNTFEAIGGKGTMRRWAQSSPRLSASDYNHLTEAGAKVVGTLLHKALLKGYDDYLARSGP